MHNLVDQHGLIPETPIHLTPSNGLHIVFGWDPDRPVTNSTGQLPEGIDVRGEGGYVIVPPSKLADGRAYTCVDHSDVLNPAKAPDWLYALILAPKRQTASEGTRPPSGGETVVHVVDFAAEGDFFKSVNRAALDNIEAWAPRLFPTAAFQPGTGAWRVTSKDLGRDLEEDLSIHPDGVQDFGPRKGMTPINVVMEWGGAPTAKAAAFWLCEALEIDPASLGWREERGAQAEATAAEPIPIFDPWEDCAVPKFPLDVLPSDVQRFASEQSAVIGCDPSAMVMACLANLSGSLDHRFELKMMRHGDWLVSPRLWMVLIGDVSCKKSPTIDKALAGLEAHQACLQAAYREELEEYEASRAGWNRDDGPPPEPPPPRPRFVVWDATPEKLGELLARSGRGILVKRDELAGWIGAMEKYGGNRGGAADRAFWLQSYNGGPYISDRVGRGEVNISNLSTTIIGGIQPQRLSELTGLTSDGLLQRFIPVMVGPSTFPVDVPSDASNDAYRRLTQELLEKSPRRLILADDALLLMEDLRRHIHELEQVTGGFAPGFQGFAGKLPGMAGSLALILHLIGERDEEELYQVSRKTVEDVSRLVLDFILPHAFEFYRTAESVTDGDRLQRLASWILTSGKSRITVRDLTHNVRHLKGKSLKDVQQKVAPLEAGGWLEPVARGPDNRAWTAPPLRRSDRRRQGLLR